MAYLQPQLSLPKGAQVKLQPDKTKTGARDGPMAVEITRDELCSMSWLERLIVLS